MDAQRQRLLAQIGRTRGTPCYVYFIDEVRQRVQALKSVLGGRFEISYAVKANPNVGLLRGLRPDVALLDVSSAGELQRALSSGCPAAHISFSGPAKRDVELQAAAESGCEIVCESADEAEALSQLGEARGSPLKILLRLNPSRMPRRFGISMAGRPSQFGIDEEDLPEQLPRLVRLTVRDRASGADLLPGVQFTLRADAPMGCAQPGANADCVTGKSGSPKETPVKGPAPGARR